MTGPKYSSDNPFAQKYSSDNPFAQGYSPENPFAGTGSSRAPEPEQGLGSRYAETIKQIVTHPIDAISGMAKSVLFDALRATVTPVDVLGGMDKPPEFISRLLPDELKQTQSLGQYGQSVLNTTLNAALPSAKSFGAAALIGAGAGALQSPDDRKLGALVGGTLGPVVHGAQGIIGKSASEIGRAAGLKRVAKSGAPLPESKIPTPAPAPEPPASPAIRDMTNAQVLDMTPTGIEIVAKQAAKEERALYTELFGAKGAKKYKAMLKASTSADASPETAAKALAGMQSMYSQLTPAQQSALDQINSKGFTSKRLKKIAQLTKDYTPENLKGVVDDDELVRMFGEVLMSNKPDRNLAGLYRLRAVYKEMQTRGIADNDALRGVYTYMVGEGIKPDGLGKMILSKMEDVRNTLARTHPETVTPPAPAPVGDERFAPPPSASSTPSRPLGPISEEQFQAEQAAITPQAPPPVDNAAALVDAARTTPFPEVPVVQGPRQASPPDVVSGPRQTTALRPIDKTEARLIELKARVARGETVQERGPLPEPATPNLDTTADELVDAVNKRFKEVKLKKTTFDHDDAENWLKGDALSIANAALEQAKGNVSRAKDIVAEHHTAITANKGDWNPDNTPFHEAWYKSLGAIDALTGELGKYDYMFPDSKVKIKAGYEEALAELNRRPDIQTPISSIAVTRSEPAAFTAPIEDGSALLDPYGPLTGRLPEVPKGLSVATLEKMPRDVRLSLEGKVRQELKDLGVGSKRYVFDDEYNPKADTPKARELIKQLRFLGEYNYLEGNKLYNRPDIKGLLDQADKKAAEAVRAKEAGDGEAYVRALAEGDKLTSDAERLIKGELASPGKAIEAVRNFAKDEAGFLDIQALTDPLQTKPDVSKLPQHSKNIQKQIEVGYKPEQGNPMRPIEGYYAALVRRTAPLERGEKTVAKATGKPIPVAQRPSAAIQLLAGWAGKAQHFLEYGGFREINGQIVPTGNKGLEQVFREAGDLNAFRRQAIAQRVAELDAAGRKVETGIDPADARQEVASASPQIKQSVDDLHTYLDGVMQFAEDGDLLDPALAQVLRQLGKAYVPLDRVLTKGAKNTGPIQYAAISTPQQFRTLIGSKLKIVDPLYSTVDYTRRIVRATELNKVGLTLIDFVKQHPNETKGWLVREKNVSASNAPNVVATGQGIQQIAKKLGINLDLNTAKHIGAILGDSNLLVEGDIMRVRVGGEIHQYRVDPVIGKVLRSIGPQQLPLWMRLVGAPTTALKIGVTANPVFGVFQAFVGAFQTKIQSQYGFRITQDPFIGLYNRVRKTPAYQEALAAGGTSAFLSATGRSTEASLRSITGGSKAARLIRSVANPLEAMRAIAEPLEEMNRLGEYIRARKQGADVLEAALAMREADTDFSMIGTQMAGFAHMIAFANPFIQAADKTGRTLAKSPTAWVAGAMGVTVPSIAFWLAGEGDNEVRDLQRSDAGVRNWFTRIPKTGEIIKIPKPYIYGEIFGATTEAVMNQMETDNPDQYATLAKGIRNSFTFLFLPTAAQTIIGALSNKNPMGWQDIVPESRAGLEPSLQYTNQSTDISKMIGETLNISPAKIDFAIQSLGGTLAGEGMKSLDRIIPEKASPPTPVSADLPLIGRFFARYPSESVEPIRTFYKNASDAQVKLATTRKLIDQMKMDQAEAYVKKHADVLGLADTYGQARQQFAEKRGLLETIRDIPNESMTPETKRELTDQILEGMIESARAVNEAVRQQRRDAKALAKVPATR